jgi:endonuclease-8
VPEGDTVWLAATNLRRALAGRRLVRSDFRTPALATADLAGREVLEVTPRGKHLLTRIDHGERDWTLHTHLKMEGSWRDYAPGDRWGRPGHTARVVLTTADRVAVGFSLGIVELLPRDREESVVAHLGPDTLGPDWDPTEAVRRLTTHPDEPIRDALLDQRCLAGVGTMWAAEMLFARRVHPQTRVADVPDLAALVVKGQELLAAAVAHRRPTMWVYGRHRMPCPRCGTPIRTAKTGPLGRERPAYWCPGCQPEP